MTLKHALVSAIADDPASVTAGEVVPSDWNADHVTNATATQVLYAGASGEVKGDAGFLFNDSVNHAALGTGTIDQNINTGSSLAATEIFNVRDTVTAAAAVSRRDVGAMFQVDVALSGSRSASQSVSGSISFVSISGANTPSHAQGAQYYSYLDSPSSTMSSMDGVTGNIYRAAGAVSNYLTAVSGGVDDDVSGVSIYSYVGLVDNLGPCWMFGSPGAIAPDLYSAATVTSIGGLFIPSITKSGGGTITTVYGIKVADQTAGGTNYQCHFGAGLYHFDALTASRWVATDASKNLVSKTDAEMATAIGTVGLTLAENTGIALDPALSADGKWSGTTITGTSGYSQAFGDLVTLDKDDSRWEAVDISVAAAATGDARGIMGMVVVTGTDGNACTILLNGNIRADANFPALTIGAPVYASTTGDVVVAQPTTTDHVIRIVGYALTADELYFNPGNSWTTHT